MERGAQYASGIARELRSRDEAARRLPTLRARVVDARLPSRASLRRARTQPDRRTHPAHSLFTKPLDGHRASLAATEQRGVP
jgi:hypothetical protein